MPEATAIETDGAAEAVAMEAMLRQSVQGRRKGPERQPAAAQAQAGPLPVLRIARRAGGVVVDERHRHHHQGTDQGGEQQEAPGGLGEKDDHRIGTGGRVNGARQHHQRDRSSGGERNRPPVRTEDEEKEKAGERTEYVAPDHIARLGEGDIGVAEHQDAGGAEGAEHQGDRQRVGEQGNGGDRQKAPQPGERDSLQGWLRRQGRSVTLELGKKRHPAPMG